MLIIFGMKETVPASPSPASILPHGTEEGWAATEEGTQSEDEQAPVKARTLPHINKMAFTRSLCLSDLEVLRL